jgi:hypothetical protein
MAWHLGYPLSQTILTNVYVEAILSPEPASLDEADFLRGHDVTYQEGSMDEAMFTILRAYCIGLLTTCHYVNESIKAEHYYEVNIFRSRDLIGKL